MQPTGAFLRARIAKRFLVFFLVGSLLPLAGLAIIAHQRIEAYLEAQGAQRLRHSAKQAGLGILDRLRMADAELALIRQLLIDEAALPVRDESDMLAAPARLGGVLVVDGQTVRTVVGDIPHVPILNEDHRAHLESGKAVLLVAGGAERPVLLARSLAPPRPQAVVWAEVNPRYLWGDASADVIEHSKLCVFHRPSIPLRCPRPTANRLLAVSGSVSLTGSRGWFEWEDAESRYLAASWLLFLGYEFAAPDWTVAWSEPKEDVLAEIVSFRTVLALFFLLTGAILFLLANVLVRRNLDPVMRLTDATRRITAGDLDARVEIRSGDEFDELARSFNAMGQRLGAQFSALEAMSEIDRAILSATDTDTVVRRFIMLSGAALDCASCNVVVLSPEGKTGTRFSVGLNGDIEEDAVRLFTGDLATLRRGSECRVLGADAAVPSYLERPRSDADHRRDYLVLPVLVENQLTVLVALEYADLNAVDAERLSHARGLADQLGVAIANASLVERLDQLSWGTLTALARTMDAKSPWTAGHSERVTDLAMSIGRRLGLSQLEIDQLHRGSMLHDIGKVAVPVTILDKPGPLSEEEFEVIRSHTLVGAEILEPVAAHADVIPIVLHHHERYDGTGYPHGLAGEQIPFLARIVAVVDVFDALITRRPYREALPFSEALEVIRRGAGRHFDPEVARVCMEILEESTEHDVEMRAAVAR